MSRAIKNRLVLNQLENFVPDAAMTQRSIEQFFAAINTPKSLACYLMFKSGEHVQLLDCVADPLHYLDAESFDLDYMAVSFLSKYTGLITGYDKKQRALDKFLQMEELCSQTNRRFLRDPEQKTHGHGHLLLSVRRKIDLILGEFDIEEFFESPAWGPGVSNSIKGFDVSAARKFQSETGITKNAYALLSSSLVQAYPLWFDQGRNCESDFTIEAGNTVITVSKNAKIDRVIAVEPGLNLFFQKAVGSMLKKRLKNRGVDTSDQERNQKAARVASVRNDVATVDFSSASDLISKAVVRNLLPIRWLTVMEMLRSERGELEGKPFIWEKFSSMGCGFTFELECLIFYAVAVVCCEATNADASLVSVYGDDVIIPVHAYPLFSEMVTMLGFLLNPAKSFTDGPFRESCGSHYFRGVDVKPIFLKDPLSNALTIYKLANSVRRASHRRNFNNGCDRRFLPYWRGLISGLPSALRSVKIPEGYGDGGILSNLDEACPSSAPNGYEGFEIQIVAERGINVQHDSRGLLLSRLHNLGLKIRDDHVKREFPSYLTRAGQKLSTLAFRNMETLRGRTKLALNRAVLVPMWYNLGCWE